MVTKRVCTFCGKVIEPGTGKMLVDPSGSVSFYCTSKCEKCVGLKRTARKIKWTKAYRKEKEIRVQHLKESKPKAEEKPKAAEKPKEVPKKEEKKGKPKKKEKKAKK